MIYVGKEMLKMINIIGITGPSGSGKSLLCRLLKEKNIEIIDADELYHSLLVPDSRCTVALAEAFGKDILDVDGTPNRKKLSKIVFSSPEKLEVLNRLVLGFVIDEIKSIITSLEQKNVKNVAVDAPTLIESGFHLECDYVVSILASKEERIERICKRDGLSQESALMRIENQKPDEFYISHSDLVITNNTNEIDFERSATDIFDKILKV